MAAEFSTQVEWELTDSGRQYFSFEGLRSPSKFYPADLVSMGPIRRSIGPVNEPYSVSNVSFEVKNRGGQYQIKKATEGYKGRRIYSYFGAIADGLAARLPVFSGAVDNYRLSNGILSLSAKDIGFDRFRKPLRATLKTLNSAVFPEMEGDQAEVLIPVVYGDVTAGALLAGGPIPGYRIDPDAAGKFRYVVAQHVMKSVDTIYVYGDSAHGITTNVTHVEYGGVTMTVIDFDADPRSPDRTGELEVTVAGKGMTEDRTTGGTLIENPVYIHADILDMYSGWDSSGFKVSLFVDAVNAAADNLYAGVSSPYKGCVVLSGDINQDWFEYIDKVRESWLLYTFATTDNLLGVYLLTNTVAATPPTADVNVTDGKDIVARSFSVTGNPNVFSEIHYQWVYNFTFGEFVSSRLSTATQAIARKAPVRSPYRSAPLPSPYRVAPKEFFGGTAEGAAVADTSVPDARPVLRLLHYVSNANTARNVAAAYASLGMENVQFCTFALPARFIGQIDLNTNVGITHWQGVAADGNGYDGDVFRIFNLETLLQPSKKGLLCMGIKLAA